MAMNGVEFYCLPFWSGEPKGGASQYPIDTSALHFRDKIKLFLFSYSALLPSPVHTHTHTHTHPYTHVRRGVKPQFPTHLLHCCGCDNCRANPFAPWGFPFHLQVSYLLQWGSNSVSFLPLKWYFLKFLLSYFSSFLASFVPSWCLIFLSPRLILYIPRAKLRAQSIGLQGDCEVPELQGKHLRPWVFIKACLRASQETLVLSQFR